MAPPTPFTLKDPELFKDQSYVGGKWVEAASGARFDIVDPGSGKVWASAPDNSEADVDMAVRAANTAFESYRKESSRQRARWLLNWDALIRENKDDIATILTYETGKPIAEAHGEIDYALSFTWWFAGEAERIFGTVHQASQNGRRVFTIKQPIGVAVALVPWNFPIAMILRKASAALAAGCTMVIKPSPETPLSVLTLAHLATKAGFPPGCLSVLTTSLANTPSLSEKLCRHPLVHKITFTGSTRVGKLIARICADGLKKVTLELGGNCPYIIFDDANLDQALEGLLLLKWRHAGQACVSANRVYVQSGVYEKFAEMVRERTSKIVVGHGAEKDTTMGPVTTPQSLEKVAAQVEDAVSRGARVLHGGQRVDRPGYFFQPTIIADATDKMRLSQEETFGPILAMYKFETEAEVVRMANDTSMGLASYFFTKNVDRTWRLLENLEAGMIGMNTGNQSAGESPFGGIKESGYGKESGKDVAVAEYVITKTGTLTVDEHF
ncbi:hypothetical protein PV10_00721 [Exophiala mesophila]|uniref:Aldehyde dehydrogenase domain-containing protein n=1 Tax=Exophiala mesophila TaxID=212818 RepID=A0A0D2ADC6_EXOME|nr:uncharacterized protein PV10_00721 [Exophiala mesophila]KIV96908.1 hypothetical protein PV10_00721 [Exophiala mesophila]